MIVTNKIKWIYIICQNIIEVNSTTKKGQMQIECAGLLSEGLCEKLVSQYLGTLFRSSKPWINVLIYNYYKNIEAAGT